MEQDKPSPSLPPTDAPAGSLSANQLGRRRLLRGGAAATPVLLTLASGPVAATSTCVVASSFVSASVYKSRNPSVSNITCISTTVSTHCTFACNNPTTTATPHCNPLSNYFSAGTTFPNMSWGTCTLSTWARSVFRNNGSGLASSGDIAILQRLVALAHGSTVFSPLYVTQLWNARNDTAMLTSLVGAGNGNWDTARLLAWLDYSASNVNF